MYLWWSLVITRPETTIRMETETRRPVSATPTSTETPTRSARIPMVRLRAKLRLETLNTTRCNNRSHNRSHSRKLSRSIRLLVSPLICNSNSNSSSRMALLRSCRRSTRKIRSNKPSSKRRKHNSRRNKLPSRTTLLNKRNISLKPKLLRLNLKRRLKVRAVRLIAKSNRSRSRSHSRNRVLLMLRNSRKLNRKTQQLSLLLPPVLMAARSSLKLNRKHRVPRDRTLLAPTSNKVSLSHSRRHNLRLEDGAPTFLNRNLNRRALRTVSSWLFSKHNNKSKRTVRRMFRQARIKAKLSIQRNHLLQDKAPTCHNRSPSRRALRTTSSRISSKLSSSYHHHLSRSPHRKRSHSHKQCNPCRKLRSKS